MLCVGEHIYRLDARHFVLLGEQLQVASLCSWVAAHIYDALWVGKENGVDDITMHTSSGRVGDDDIGLAVLLNEVLIQDVLHVAGKELRVLDAVYLRVHLSILDSLRHILDANDLPGISCHEVGDGAGASVEVVN